MIKPENVETVRYFCQRFGTLIWDAALHDFLFNDNTRQRLGSGTYGVCYSAGVASNTWVTKLFDDTESSVESLLQEVEAMEALKDIPGIQKMIAVCPERLTIVTEYAG
ncbi:hypothetical protein OTU49_002285 [Cherax quadricarinatus]|uniref:Protein kinase domain-containing protein n=1 Tax=Cherax quadricarinatus TaxID=27406 RepID=A0AAW0XF16_CHEQU